MDQRSGLILASASPRRRDLLRQLGFAFEVRPTDVEEVLPQGLPNGQAALYLAVLKASAATAELLPGQVLLAADTTVLLGDALINKPIDAPEAERMLLELCGHTHRVITGVCIVVAELDGTMPQLSFQVETSVTLLPASKTEIAEYVCLQRPLDKAGAYGIQDWLGWAKCSGIVGSYSNVMGLPTAEVFAALRDTGLPYGI